MPEGVPFVRAFETSTLSDIADAFAGIADALAVLNAKGVFHRDIKPSNLLIVDGTACLADFGLADFPDKDDRTGTREALGPRWTTAPEVRRDSKLGSSQAAEVYALAKTMWCVAMHEPKGFEGQYGADDTLGLKRRWSAQYLDPLDALLSMATANDPLNRPALAKFAASLREWMRVDSEFQLRNDPEWASLIRSIVGPFRPERAEWTDPAAIVAVLSVVAAKPNASHVFMPGVGGVDMNAIAPSARELGCIEFTYGGTPYLLRPKRLIFESCGLGSEWDYFYFELDRLSPSGVYEEWSDIQEEVTSIPGRPYVSLDYWESGEYAGRTLPEGSSPLVRLLGGAIAIFRRGSVYNRTSSTYDGRHSKLGADAFKQHVRAMADDVRNREWGVG
jgi:serine/threonine-protein kinase